MCRRETTLLSLLSFGFFLSGAVLCSNAQAASDVVLSKGQTVFVPVYSQAYYGDRKRLLDLTVTLSIRNANMTSPITITSVKYYDAKGQPVKSYQDEPLTIPPLGSANYLVGERDNSGGPTPSFIVKWTSQDEVNPPRIEGVMIGVISGQGISFAREGEPITDPGR